MPVKSYALTDVGLRRTHNEDSYCVNDDLSLYLVADGMGGHAAGEIASVNAVKAIDDFVRQADRDRDMMWPFGIDESLAEYENVLLSSVKVANQVICRMSAEKPELSGMGTTIAGLQFHDRQITVFHVGDSRIYRIRGVEIAQVTTDHSWVNEQLQRRMITEEEARTHRWKNVITRALGNKSTIEVDIETHDVEHDDILLICTDGLSGLVSDEVVVGTLNQHSDHLEEVCPELIAQANTAGGHDNITVLLAHYTEE